MARNGDGEGSDNGQPDLAAAERFDSRGDRGDRRRPAATGRASAIGTGTGHRAVARHQVEAGRRRPASFVHRGDIRGATGRWAPMPSWRRSRPRSAAARAARWHRGRTQAVPGEGNPLTDVLLVGEGPGCPRGRHRTAVRRSRRAAARRAARDASAGHGSDVFIANVVKCRPPGNRDPEPEEIAACASLPRSAGGGARSGRDRDPGTALAAALPARRAHLAVHGSLRRAGGRFVFPMYHPAAALHQASLRETLFADMRGLPGGAAGRPRGDRGRAESHRSRTNTTSAAADH